MKSGTRRHWNSYIQEWPLKVFCANTVTFTGSLSLQGGQKWFFIGLPLTAFLQPSSSWHLHFLCSPAEISPVQRWPRLGLQVCSRWDVRTENSGVLLACPCSVVSFPDALPCLWRAAIEAQRKIYVGFSPLPAWWEPRGWGRRRLKASHSLCLTSCKERTFWMWSIAYFGKVIKFSEVGQLFLSLSGRAFNAGFVLDVVKVGRFHRGKVPPLWGNDWRS